MSDGDPAGSSAAAPDEPARALPEGMAITPEPTDAELAAILAAYEALWPRGTDAVTPDGLPRWRFAGRWWTPRPRYGGWA